MVPAAAGSSPVAHPSRLQGIPALRRYGAPGPHLGRHGEQRSPRRPFRDETPYGPWHYSLRQGEMVLKALAELPDITRAIIAVKQMTRDDLEAVVLERLYVFRATKGGPPYAVSEEFNRWLNPKPDS